jgi:hypothetical protein
MRSNRVGRGTRLLAGFVGFALLFGAILTFTTGGRGGTEMVIAAAFCLFMAWTGFDLQGGSRRAQNRRFGEYGAMLRRSLKRR